MADPSQIQIDDSLSFESALAQLQEIVTRLESGELNLQEALKLYETGQALARHCSRLLEQAELKVRQLSEDQMNLA